MTIYTIKLATFVYQLSNQLISGRLFVCDYNSICVQAPHVPTHVYVYSSLCICIYIMIDLSISIHIINVSYYDTPYYQQTQIKADLM